MLFAVSLVTLGIDMPFILSLHTYSVFLAMVAREVDAFARTSVDKLPEELWWGDGKTSLCSRPIDGMAPATHDRSPVLWQLSPIFCRVSSEQISFLSQQ